MRPPRRRRTPARRARRARARRPFASPLSAKNMLSSGLTRSSSRAHRDARVAERQDERVEAALLDGDRQPAAGRAAGAHARGCRRRSPARDRRRWCAARRRRRAPAARELRGGAVPHDPALADHRVGVAHLLQLADLVAGQQHRDALVGELAHQRGDGAGARGVKAARGLVEQQQPRRAQQRGGDAQPLAHPGGVAAHPAAGAARSRPTRSSASSMGPARHVAVELGQQREVGCGPTGRDRSSAPRRTRRRRSSAADPGPPSGAQQRDRAGVGRDQPEQQPQQRRLAGAVGAQQAVDLAGLHHEVQPVDRGRRLEALDQASGGDGLHGGHYKGSS